jgi:hypothetical protein
MRHNDFTRFGLSHERKAVNIQNLGKYENLSAGVRDRVGNAYEKLAGTDDYQKNSNNLRYIQVAVVSVVMVS